MTDVPDFVYLARAISDFDGVRPSIAKIPVYHIGFNVIPVAGIIGITTSEGKGYHVDPDSATDIMIDNPSFCPHVPGFLPLDKDNVFTDPDSAKEYMTTMFSGEISRLEKEIVRVKSWLTKLQQ